ncbi:pyridoxal kinase PdxY [Vibrio inusitatus NBRC 102082]|uniref:pyridoxal kinase n=1 Tax=Vibrio inusitatus NBRC 102082 TaxID=1219070 RepID=A0A4Y3HY37_9VIBR|nr:pyridoxal kinase PdxY [Vibrio inusitatus]GEA51602.1 pyridoxal kinase PdxY [Vibrio inusitatus NBRC 102082]
MKGIISIQSHVVYGSAGNSSAVFPLQRLGFNVWPIHTVQFSNHTQYPQGWTGDKFDPSTIGELRQGLSNIDALEKCHAVLSGYLGSSGQTHEVLKLVNEVRSANPEAIYVCDPVMGDAEKGCVVSEEVTGDLVNHLMPAADVIVPNQFELSCFTQMKISCLDDAIAACQKALTQGPKVVLVKHLHSISSDQFIMILATKEGFYMVERPLLSFERQPVGVGDLISALFTGGLLKGLPAVEAFVHANNACFAVLKETSDSGEWELQTVAAQQSLVEPKEYFAALRLA